MNLWDSVEKNPDDQQVPVDTAEHGSGVTWRSTRRLSEQGLLSLLREWLLQDYAAVYCRSLGATRIFRRCYWIDALGIDAKASVSASIPEDAPMPARTGKGRKKNGLVPPALQLITRLSQTLMQEEKPITLNGIVLSLGSSKRKEIRVLSTEQDNSSITGQTISVGKESSILQASWLEVGSQVLKEIEQSPAIFLLNPFGATLFSNEDLAPLYQRAIPTELCLLIPHKQIELRLAAAQGASEQAVALASALTNLLRGDRWKALPLEEEQRSRASAGFCDLLAASVQRHFLLPIQLITFPIQIGLASVEPAPYTLLFATRRQDSLYAMNDAVCLRRRQVEEQSYTGVLSEEWFQTQQHLHFEEGLQQLSQRICQLGQAQRARRWSDLRQQVLLEHFGYFTLQEYDGIIQRLLLDGYVRCSWRRPAIDEYEERVPGNDDTLIWR